MDCNANVFTRTRTHLNYSSTFYSQYSVATWMKATSTEHNFSDFTSLLVNGKPRTSGLVCGEDPR